MMKKLSKILAAALALVMCLSLLPMSAFAAKTNEGTINSYNQAESDKTAADAAKEATDTAKTDAEAAETATNKDSLVGKTNDAYDAYQEALKEAEKAESKVEEANEAIKQIETDTNVAVDELDGTAGAALEKAEEAVDEATAEGGNVSKAVEAADAAAEAAKAAQELAESEEATTAEKRAAADAAKEAADTANQAVEVAQATLDAAQSEVNAAKAAYEKAKQDYAALIATATGGIKEIEDGSKDAIAAVKAANEALEAAKIALETAEAKEGEAKSAAEAAQAAADKAQASATAAANALTAANAQNIADKLGVEDITGMDDAAIDKAKADAEAAALDAFEKAYKESDNHWIESNENKAFEKLKNQEISAAELIAMQKKLDEARAERDRARQEYEAAEQARKEHPFDLDAINLASAKSLEKTQKEIAYNGVYNEISETLKLDIRDQTDTDRHDTIWGVFRAKTDYEVAKENAAKYAEAAKAVVAAQEAQKAADAAKAKADAALKEYNDAKEALEKAKELATLQAETEFKALTDREAALNAAQAKLDAAQTELTEAKQKAEDAGKTAQDILDNLPPETEPDFGGGDPVETEIDDVAVPLASGPVTRAEFIDYLWRHEGEPEGGVCTFTDVPADHDYVLALGWAQANGIAVAYEDGSFEPDELVTVAAVRELLGNFAEVFGTNAVDVAELTTLTGDDDEAVLNCDEILAEFFGEEYAAGEIAA